MAAFVQEGINVNFAQFDGQSGLKVATYERGVEDETYSCGTGVVATAIAATQHFKPQTNELIEWAITTKGGQLCVSMEVQPQADGVLHFTNIWLKGPATWVFEGFIKEATLQP